VARGETSGHGGLVALDAADQGVQAGQVGGAGAGQPLGKALAAPFPSLVQAGLDGVLPGSSWTAA
jgi:hypothetical protein